MTNHTKEQFRDNVLKIINRQNIPLYKVFFLCVYYGIAKNLPWASRFRTFLASKIFKNVGINVKINKGVDFGSGINILIGDYSSLNRGCWISNDTVIGRNVMMGPNIAVISGTHNFQLTNISMREQGAPSRKKVIIGDDVWIGTQSIILPGIKVGSHSIIGAGSVVTKDVPEWAIVGGNPAKIIKYRSEVK